MARSWWAALAFVVLLGASASAALAAKPVQIALFDPAQIFPRDEAIHGIRFNLIYGSNIEMKGLDLGVANRVSGDFTGVQWGIVGMIGGSFVGWQTNYINLNEGSGEGLMTSLYNQTRSFTGVQFGVVNYTDAMEGLQVGLVNVTRTMNGLQIGLVNVIQSKDDLPVLPIVNWVF